MIRTDGKQKVAVVGYAEATITQEFSWWISEHLPVTIMEPASLVISDEYAYIVSITRDKNDRQQAINRLCGQTFATFIHPTVVTHGNCNIQPGTFIGPHSSIYFNSTIGEHCIIGPYCMISHNTNLGTSVVMHPGSMIAGSSTIGNHCLLGMRSTVLDKISICDDVFVGAGSLVNKDIVTPGKYIGNPCRKF